MSAEEAGESSEKQGQDQAISKEQSQKTKANLEKQTQNDAQNRQRLEKAISAAQKVVASQKQAQSLKERALQAVNPKERMRLLKESYQKEVEAHGQSKLAKRLQSGVWQGGTAGGGIGAGIAMSVGAVTGTLVTGLVSVPTVLLGGLVGAGTGAIHGPWFTIPGMGGKKKDQPSEEEIRDRAMKEAEALDQAVETGANSVPQPPPEIDEAEAQESVNGGEHTNGKQEQPQGDADGRATPVAERKKPRKLQVRSGNETTPTPERKKPRKLQVRSVSERTENM